MASWNLGDSQQPLGFAHRGGAALWPENTLAAFAGALQLGCTHLESDVRMTSDGELVLFHDEDLSRTTDGKGLVRAHRWHDLQSLDAAFHFCPPQPLAGSDPLYPERAQGHRIVQLSQLVELDSSAFLNLEIKEWGPPGQSVPEALWQFIVDRQLEGRVLVAAERHDLLQRFRVVSGGRVPTGASRRECLEFLALSRLGLSHLHRFPCNALQLPPHAAGLPVVTEQLLRAAHRQKIAVHVWTIDDPRQMRELLALGVDGLMTDRPDRLVRVLSP